MRPPRRDRRQIDDLTVSSTVVLAARGALAALGYDLAEEPAAPTAPRVPVRELDRLLERGALALRLPALGIAMADQMPIGVFREMDYLLSASPTLRSGIERVVALYAVFTDRIRLSLVEQPGLAILRLRCFPDAAISHHATDAVLTSAFQRLRHVLGPAFRLREVVLSHDPGASTRAYEQAFGAPVRAGGGIDELRFDGTWLDQPLRTATPQLGQIIELELRQQLRDNEDVFVFSVRQAIAELLPEGKSGLQHVAAHLRLKTRLLQQRLAARRTSHRALIDEVRQQRAPALLADDRLTIAEIAERLGFDDASSFFRSYRRWTGTTPRRTRRAGG